MIRLPTVHEVPLSLYSGCPLLSERELEREFNEGMRKVRRFAEKRLPNRWVIAVKALAPDLLVVTTIEESTTYRITKSGLRSFQKVQAVAFSLLSHHEHGEALAFFTHEFLMKAHQNILEEVEGVVEKECGDVEIFVLHAEKEEVLTVGLFDGTVPRFKELSIEREEDRCALRALCNVYSAMSKMGLGHFLLRMSSSKVLKSHERVLLLLEGLGAYYQIFPGGQIFTYAEEEDNAPCTHVLEGCDLLAEELYQNIVMFFLAARRFPEIAADIDKGIFAHYISKDFAGEKERALHLKLEALAQTFLAERKVGGILAGCYVSSTGKLIVWIRQEEEVLCLELELSEEEVALFRLYEVHLELFERAENRLGLPEGVA